MFPPAGSSAAIKELLPGAEGSQCADGRQGKGNKDRYLMWDKPWNKTGKSDLIRVTVDKKLAEGVVIYCLSCRFMAVLLLIKSGSERATRCAFELCGAVMYNLIDVTIVNYIRQPLHDYIIYRTISHIISTNIFFFAQCLHKKRFLGYRNPRTYMAMDKKFNHSLKTRQQCCPFIWWAEHASY